MKQKTLYIYGKNVIAEMVKNQSDKVVEIAVAHEAFTPEVEELFHNARKSNIKTKQVTADNLKEYIVKGSNIITFNILNPLTPKSRLESIDGRLLGILVEKVIFE